MSSQGKTVYLKQSGELLAAGGASRDLWTPEGLRQSTDKVARVMRRRREIGVRGLVLVSGAGNIARGENLRSLGLADGMSDLIGRGATVLNTLILAGGLRARDIDVRTFIADTMQLRDMSLPEDELAPYTLDGTLEAFEQGQVVLIAGGTGEDNKTTDNAVMDYARRHTAERPDDEVRVIKGTKHDGVYTKDPAKHGDARRFVRISAGHMLANHEKYPAVDRSSLENIQRSRLEMTVYADGQHDLADLLTHPGDIGTVIYPGDEWESPELAD